MTNIKQKKWLVRELLARNPDLLQIDAYSIWIKPIQHVAARIYIDACLDPNVFDPNWNVAPLYWAGSRAIGEVGNVQESFSRETPPAPFTREYFLEPGYERRPEFPQLAAWGKTVELWKWSDPEIASVFTRAVETQVLPLLRPMARDHRAYLDFYRSYIVRRGQLHDEEHFAIALAAGELDDARAFLARIMWKYETDSYGDYVVPEPLVYPPRGQRTLRAKAAYDKAVSCFVYRRKRRRILDVLEPLRVGDRAALAAIVRRWEAEAMRVWKLERYWEPAPLPIEQVTS